MEEGIAKGTSFEMKDTPCEGKEELSPTQWDRLKLSAMSLVALSLLVAVVDVRPGSLLASLAFYFFSTLRLLCSRRCHTDADLLGMSPPPPTAPSAPRFLGRRLLWSPQSSLLYPPTSP